MTDIRIEINADGIGGISVLDYQTHMQSFVSDADSVIASFKAVKSNTYNLNGGVGNLQGALDSISTRVQQEETKRTAATQVQSKANDFLSLAARVDKQVASLVNSNKDEFYRTNPGLKPNTSVDETTWYEDAWNWLCGAKDAVVAGVNEVWTGIKDTIKKAWDGLVEFYNEHKKAIATILLVAAAVLVIVFAPTKGIGVAILIGAAKGLLLGAAIGGISGGVESVANGESFWKGVEDGAFSGAISGAIAGAVFTGLGMAGQAIGKSIECMSIVGKGVQCLSKACTFASLAMDGFDTLTLADKMIDPSSNLIADLNAKAHSNPMYNFAQVGVNVIAAFTGGMTQTMTCFVAGTLVLTVAGLRAIEDIKVGDMVISTDINTGITEEKRVIRTYVREKNQLIDVHTEKDTIVTTPEHPFFVKGVGFVEARALAEDALLIDAFQKSVRIINCEYQNLDKFVKVYNLKIEDYHTYYVGEQSILVHNADYLPVKGVIKRIDHEDGSVSITKRIDGYGEVDILYTRGSDGNLHPRFESYTHPDYPNLVPVDNLTGDHYYDFKLANKAVGLPESPNSIPEGYTWHHLEDGKHMILVDKRIHNVADGGFSHIGGASILKSGQ